MFIADLHIHSKYSRACSKNLDLPHIWAWARLKGIDLIATGDFTHPAWFSEISKKLDEKDEGVYELKKESREETKDVYLPSSCQRPARFILTAEISLIYKKKERVRKVHHVVLAPNLETVAKINVELEKRGNIRADGRPILGMDSKDLLELLLGISEKIELIPAHVWTPHFAIFGSKSGFDSVEECFDDLAGHIHALETGLSSDPPMNWRLSQNDKYALISCSDAHSLVKLGREATIFDCQMNYPEISRALREDHAKVAGTIEFFPEEGKYHADGLRQEGLCLTPEETKKNKYISPKSGKPLTVGVLHRVAELADRQAGIKSPTARGVWYIIPLVEIISEIIGVGPQSKAVQQRYFRLLEKIGPEFFILKDAPVEKIVAVDEMIGEAIRRLRQREVIIQPGYDGEYGVIKLFQSEEIKSRAQISLL